MGSSAARRVNMPPTAEPNVIPFIDVLLVLLIIFMVTAPKPTVDLRLDLPRSEQGGASLIDPTIVELRAVPNGYRLFVSGAETTLDLLASRTFEHILTADPALEREDILAEGRVFIRADLDVAYQNVVSVTDTLQNEGFEKVSIAAQRADAE
ncbi:MAG: biopolymer transporter ExbD [Alphaproteobacteria bacterium]|nr:biopolymer transporter ExbD [Alphaproteobacteria bacterium]